MGNDWKTKTEEITNSKLPKRRPEAEPAANIGVVDPWADDLDIRSFWLILQNSNGKKIQFKPGTKAGKHGNPPTNQTQDDILDVSGSTGKKDHNITESSQDQEDDDANTRVLKKMKDDGFIKAAVKILRARATEAETDLFRLSAELICNILVSTTSIFSSPNCR